MSRPVDCLPLELLSEIFVHVADAEVRALEHSFWWGTSSRSGYLPATSSTWVQWPCTGHTTYSVTQVSRLWRAAALGMPHLWSNVFIAVRTPRNPRLQVLALQSSLQRSRDAPLRVRFQAIADTTCALATQAALSVIWNDRGRLVSLDIGLPFAEPLRPTTFPRLAHLSLRTQHSAYTISLVPQDRGDDAALLWFARANMPSLSQINYHGETLYPPTITNPAVIPWRQITVLDLRLRWVMWQNIVQVLAVAVQVQVLTIVQGRRGRRGYRGTLSPTPVILPSLKEAIFDMECSDLIAFLAVCTPSPGYIAVVAVLALVAVVAVLARFWLSSRLSRALGVSGFPILCLREKLLSLLLLALFVVEAMVLFSRPINRLPTELLAKIFRDATALDVAPLELSFWMPSRVEEGHLGWVYAPRPGYSPWNISQVSSVWRSIALKTPGLWSNVFVHVRPDGPDCSSEGLRRARDDNIKMQNSVLHHILIRSRPAPLRVRLKAAPSSDIVLVDRVLGKMLLLHGARIELLHVALPSVTPISRISLPTLRHLVLREQHSSPPGNSSDPFNYFAGADMPRLSRIDYHAHLRFIPSILLHTTIPWEQITVINLRFGGISWRDVLQLLVVAVHVQTFSIAANTTSLSIDNMQWPPPPPPPPTVILPSLTTANFHLCLSDMFLVLRAIQTPGLRHLDLHADAVQYDPDPGDVYGISNRDVSQAIENVLLGPWNTLVTLRLIDIPFSAYTIDAVLVFLVHLEALAVRLPSNVVARSRHDMRDIATPEGYQDLTPVLQRWATSRTSPNLQSLTLMASAWDWAPRGTLLELLQRIVATDVATIPYDYRYTIGLSDIAEQAAAAATAEIPPPPSATPPSPRRAPHVHPAASSQPSHARPAAFPRPDTRAHRVPTVRSLRPRTPRPVLAVARAPASSPLALSANAESAPGTDRGPPSMPAPAPLLLPRAPAIGLRASGHSRIRAHACRDASMRPPSVARAHSPDRDRPPLARWALSIADARSRATSSL
ncbi:hypothetical protein K523DRAFT_413068 [Schizophyllum commune Tattone D]|nr:hypothetical protein K523DRAFT_413068 [Schizophyllum commune Tattone D]